VKEKGQRKSGVTEKEVEEIVARASLSEEGGRGEEREGRWGIQGMGMRNWGSLDVRGVMKR
jgi:hypothetical protein